MRSSRGETVESLAALYWRAMFDDPNGWGQHTVRNSGTEYDGAVSHSLLLIMQLRYGREAADAALDAEYRANWRQAEATAS